MTSKYPSELSADDLAKFAHISEEQIHRDIRDTEAEILSLELLLEADRTTAEHHPLAYERRMADFRFRARPTQIAERKEFIAFLNLILTARAAEVAS